MNTKKQKENKEIKINNTSEEKEVKKLDKKTFKRIKEKFRQYWRYLFGLIFIYIACYLVWFFSSTWAREMADRKGWNGSNLTLVLVLILVQGLLFSLDGFVTALLKSPFNQMCYTINKAEGIPDDKKDYIITKATESNEHCKETLKKFGILTIMSELARVFIKINKADESLQYEKLMVLSYVVPLLFAALAIWLISRELKKIEKNLNPARGREKKQDN